MQLDRLRNAALQDIPELPGDYGTEVSLIDAGVNGARWGVGSSRGGKVVEV